MTKYIYLFYILLGVCLLAGFGSAFDSGQEHDVVRTVDLENSAVALCNISESNNGQEKKEINNESYHFYKVGIGGAATSFPSDPLSSSISSFCVPSGSVTSSASAGAFSVAPCAPPKFCELIPLLPS